MSAHDSKCFNEVYQAYIINHIFYKKLLGPTAIKLDGGGEVKGFNGTAIKKCGVCVSIGYW